MKIELRDFFTPIHFDEDFKDKDYELVQPYIEFAKSLSELTYQSIYLVDYYRRCFLYVSNNPIFLCGESPDKVLALGYLFYFKHVPEKDLKMLLKINVAGFSFFKKLPIEDLTKYSITYDFHLIKSKGRPLLINHKLKPVLLDKNSNPWIALCMVSVSSQPDAGHVKFQSSELKKRFELNFKENKWREIEWVKLTVREKEILQYSAQGFTMKNIADKLKISSDTVKFHKKNIFSKLEVYSTTEAVAAAINLALL